ncbi:hypothetical protein DDF62_11275 [Caulobacter radicis]|nr:hypothetical protein DDF62_11275 [Caulobacter radicis]
MRGFRKSFSYERFFLDRAEPAADLARYLNSLELLARSRGHRPVLKYVRSQGRIGWIRQNCGGVHLALLRPCFDQFRSYMWNAEHGNLYFMAANCQIFAQNVSAFDAELAAKLVKIPVFQSPNLAVEQAYYAKVAANLDIHQLYFIHAYLWKRQFRHALEAADAIFDIAAGPERIAEMNALMAEHDFKLDLSGVRPSKIDTMPQFKERFARIEALADYCLWSGGHVRMFKRRTPAHRFLQERLEAEAVQAERLSEVGPFERFSSMEMLGALDPEGRRAPELPDPCAASFFGGHSVPEPLRTVPHRLSGDADNVLRVDAQAMYVPPGAALRLDAQTQIYTITSARPERSLVAFGPHWVLPAGRYSLTLTYDGAPLPASADGAAMLDIVGDYGAIRVLEAQPLPLKGWANETVVFSCDRSVPAFEVRIHAEGAALRVASYTLRREDGQGPGA